MPFKRLPGIAAVIITLVFSVICLHSKAQNLHIIDSLQKEIDRAKEDTNKTRLYYRIWQQYRNNDIDQAEKYARLGLAHAQKMKWEKGIGAFYLSIGEGFDNKRQPDSALSYYNKAIVIYQKIGNAKGLAGLYNNLSALYGNGSDYVKGIEYGFKALNIALEAKDTSYSVLSYNNIGKYYFNQKNYPKAKEYATKALDLAEQAGLREGAGHSCSVLAMIFAEEKDTVKSIDYYDRAITIYEEDQNLLELAQAYSNLSVIKKDHREKLEYSFKARTLFDSLQLTNHIVSITNLGNIGADLFNLVRFRDKLRVSRGGIIPLTDKDILNKGEEYLEKSVRLSRQTGEAGNLYHFLRVLGELEEYRNNPAKALAYYKESYAISDSLFSQENKNQIAELESKTLINQRDKLLAINQLELSSARRTRLALIAGAILLFIIGGLLFYQNVQRRRSNARLEKLNNELEEANKIKTKFFGILSHDLRSPVSSLIHFLHLQKEAPDLLDEDSVNLRRQQLATSAENLLETMESVLLWSKSQMDRFAPQIKAVAVNDLYEYLRKTIAHDPAIKITYSDPENISLTTDADYLKTIMYNLTANAIKALKGTPAAELEWKAMQHDGKVLLRVADNGPGIPPDLTGALYDRQLDIGTKHGFGLHIVRELAEAIGCKIVLDTGKNKGTIFTLILAS